jgi:hypothetical protein
VKVSSLASRRAGERFPEHLTQTSPHSFIRSLEHCNARHTERKESKLLPASVHSSLRLYFPISGRGEVLHLLLHIIGGSTAAVVPLFP